MCWAQLLPKKVSISGHRAGAAPTDAHSAGYLKASGVTIRAWMVLALGLNLTDFFFLSLGSVGFSGSPSAETWIFRTVLNSVTLLVLRSDSERLRLRSSNENLNILSTLCGGVKFRSRRAFLLRVRVHLRNFMVLLSR